MMSHSRSGSWGRAVAIPTEADLWPGRDEDSKDKVGACYGQGDTPPGSSPRGCDVLPS